MNFFGHACVASWERSDPAYVLGAMLPDFAGMIRGRIAEIERPDLRAGIELHRRTDAIFHRMDGFAELCASSARDR